MQTSRITIDGLWRCICPSFESVVLARPPILSATVSRPCIKDNNNRSYQARALQTSSVMRNFTALKVPSVVNHPADVQCTKKNQNRTELFDPMSNDELHERLRYLKVKHTAYDELTDLVKYLVVVRGVKPALIHYDALIFANSDARRGSAAVVRNLLKEMKESRVGTDAELYHTVLQTLAIHPDYLLRAQMLQEMRQRSISLSPGGWHNLVLGLLRDRQIEVAIDRLEQMQIDGIKVQQWLYDIFLHQLCEANELDAAFKLLNRINLVDQRVSSFTAHMWYYLLDTFSRAFHYDGTRYIWNARVPQLYLKPSDGMCLSVMNTAARHGDPTLAVDCMHILSSRTMMLASYHYEALLVAHVKAGDFYNSFRILTVMSKAGVAPDFNTTRPLFERLTSSRDENAAGAWKILKQICADGHFIHISAINVVIESQFASRQYREMLELYKEIHLLTTHLPNLETFNLLLRGVRHLHADIKARSMFIASEMKAFHVKPNNITYDRLVLACLIDGDIEDAFKYLAEMVEEGEQYKWWLRDATVVLLLTECAKRRDDRTWEVLEEHCRRRKSDHNLYVLRRDLEKAWNGEVHAKYKPARTERHTAHGANAAGRPEHLLET